MKRQKIKYQIKNQERKQTGSVKKGTCFAAIASQLTILNEVISPTTALCGSRKYLIYIPHMDGRGLVAGASSNVTKLHATYYDVFCGIDRRWLPARAQPRAVFNMNKTVCGPFASKGNVDKSYIGFIQSQGWLVVEVDCCCLSCDNEIVRESVITTRGT